MYFSYVYIPKRVCPGLYRLISLWGLSLLKSFLVSILKEEVPVHLNYEIHSHIGKATADSVLDKHESHPLRDLQTQLPQQSRYQTVKTLI